MSAKKIHGMSAVRPPTSLTHQLTMTSMTPSFWAKPRQIGQTHKREEEVDGEAGEELLWGLVEDETADSCRCDEAQQAHVDVTPSADDEHQAEDDHADQFRTHGSSVSFIFTMTIIDARLRRELRCSRTSHALQPKRNLNC